MPELAWILGLFGLLAIMLAAARSAAGRQGAAAGYAAQSVALVGAAAALGSVAADLGSYEPRIDNRPVANLYFEQVGTERFRVTLTRLPGGRMQVFELVGVAWRLDARTVDFGGWVGAVGLQPAYRLDRLMAVERPGGDAPTGVTNGFALGARAGPDLWRSARERGRWRNLVIAGYARSEELPMSHQARFELLIAGQRIEVRAANAAAEAAAAPAP